MSEAQEPASPVSGCSASASSGGGRLHTAASDRNDTRTLVTVSGVRRLDPRRPDDDADAVVIDGGRIAWIGRRDRAPEVGRTEQFDGWLAPGFVDAHVHGTATGLAGDGVGLGDCTSLAEALERIREHAGRVHEDTILGGQWDETTWPEQRPPEAQELRDVAADRVVMLDRVDSHSCVVDPTTLARVIAALDPHHPHIVTDGAGDPTGWLKESAAEAARRIVYEDLSTDRLALARRTACERALALGITSFHEMGHPGMFGDDDARAWAAGDWPVDVQVWWAHTDVEQRPEGTKPGGDLFLDGSIGSTTAAVSGGYLDADGSGQLFHDDEEVARFFISATRAGVSAGVHAIGDRAIAQAVRAITAAGRTCGESAVRSCRHRIEHVELADESHVDAMARHGVVASVQPAFDATWGGHQGLYARRFGRDAALRSNPFAWFQRAGVTMAFGSDSTVTAMAPWAAVVAAERHRGGFGVDRSTAWASHVAGGRYAAGQDDVGAIAVGQRADLALWDGDPLRTEDPTQLVCGATWVRGVVEHRA